MRSEYCPRRWKRVSAVILWAYCCSYAALRQAHAIIHSIGCERGYYIYPSAELPRRLRDFLHAAYSPLMVLEEISREAASAIAHLFVLCAYALDEWWRSAAAFF